jgi:hypothetical protein
MRLSLQKRILTNFQPCEEADEKSATPFKARIHFFYLSAVFALATAALNYFVYRRYGFFPSALQNMLFLALCVPLFFQDKMERNWFQKRKTKLFFILSISLLFSFYLWGENLKAKWGLVDDHMIMHYFIGNQDGVSVLDIPSLLMSKTEVGKFGNSTINRPFYYFGRLVEAALWQKNVFLWYLGRLFLFFVSFAIGWWLLQKILGVLYAGIFLGFIFISPYWGWIWGYLGPAESYAMFGCALFFLGFFDIVGRVKQGKIENKYWSGSALLTAGSLIAIGSKENFLFLFLPLIYLAVLLFKKKIKDPTIIASLVLVFVYGFYIFVGIFFGLEKAGGDVYGQNIQLSERLNLTLHGLLLALRGVHAVWIFIFLVVAGFFVRCFKENEYFQKYKETLKIFSGISLVLLVLYLSQVFFYNGGYPPTTLRYSYPGMLAVPLFSLLLLWNVISIFELVGADKYVLKKTVGIIFAALLAIIFIDGYKDAKGFVKKNIRATSEFSSEMEAIKGNLEMHPERAVVIDSHSIWNVEPIASVHAYLLADGIQNPMFLRMNYPIVNRDLPGHAIDGKIHDFLSHVSLGGNCGYIGADWTFLSGGDCDQWSFAPIQNFNDQKNYVNIKIDENNRVTGELKRQR